MQPGVTVDRTVPPSDNSGIEKASQPTPGVATPRPPAGPVRDGWLSLLPYFLLQYLRNS